MVNQAKLGEEVGEVARKQYFPHSQEKVTYAEDVIALAITFKSARRILTRLTILTKGKVSPREKSGKEISV